MLLIGSRIDKESISILLLDRCVIHINILLVLQSVNGSQPNENQNGKGRKYLTHRIFLYHLVLFNLLGYGGFLLTFARWYKKLDGAMYPV